MRLTGIDVVTGLVFAACLLAGTEAVNADASLPQAVGPQCTGSPPVMWKRQFGTDSSEWATGVATDRSGDILLTGITLNSPDLNWVAKLTPTGDPIWWREPQMERSQAVASDADGNVIVVGTGADYLHDFFNVAKYGPLGDSLWTGEYRAPGWTDSISTRAGYSPVSVGVDADGNIVIGGTTARSCRQAHSCDVYLDAWVVKLSPSGDLLWWVPIGSDAFDEWTTAVGVDSTGYVLVSGTASDHPVGLFPSPGWYAPWILKFSPSGNLIWSHVPENAGDMRASGLAVGADDNFIVSGGRYVREGDDPSTLRWTPAGGWIVKYSPTADLLWRRHLFDQPEGVATDAADNVVIYGNTPGKKNSDPSDVWVSKRDPEGNFLWKRKLRTAELDMVSGLAIDAEDNVVALGTTYGSLAGPNAGEADAWIAKLHP